MTTDACVPVAAVLFDPVSGERVTYTYVLDPKYADTEEFLWTEGNYSCDCNRRLFIARILSKPEPDPNLCGDVIVLESLTVNGTLVAWETP